MFRLQLTPLRWLLVISCLITLFGLVPTETALAAPPLPPDVEICAECHPDEVDPWKESPHAQVTDNEGNGIITCQDCHGEYVENHPEAGMMSLTVGSTVCKDCHITTFAQWEDSQHAQVGVECTSCHLSHSQQFRLTDEALCNSCHSNHLNDFFHTIHARETACTDCHLPSTAVQPAELPDTTQATDPVLVHSHDFTAVSLGRCMNCHRESVYEAENLNVSWKTKEQLVAMADRVPELATELEEVKETNQSLKTMVPVSLGLGVGLGGIIGVAFILVISDINQRKTK